MLYVQLVDCSEASRATHARTHSRTRSSSHRSFHCLAFSAANIFTTDNSVRFNWDRPGKQHRSQQPTQLISFAGKCRQKKISIFKNDLVGCHSTQLHLFSKSYFVISLFFKMLRSALGANRCFASHRCAAVVVVVVVVVVVITTLTSTCFFN